MQHDAAPANDNLSGFFWCAATGAGGGGNSQWWGRPIYQVGPGVNNPLDGTGNGTTQCALAKDGTPCREDPDVSANADEYTPYAEYCTGNANTPFSVCAHFSGRPPGLVRHRRHQPVVAVVVSDHRRPRQLPGPPLGNANPLLYLLFNMAPRVYFHDINGTGHSTPTTTACSRPTPAMTRPPGSARRTWRH